MTWRVLDHEESASGTEADEAVARGVEQLLAGDEDGAAASFERALALSPDHPEATYDRAVLAWDRGELADDEVVRRVQAARERHLGSGRATFLLGLVLNERGTPERARAAFEKAARQGCADEAPGPAPSWLGAPSGRRPRCFHTLSFLGRDARSVAVAPRARRALVATSELAHVVDLDDLSVRATLTFDDTVECTAAYDGERPLGFAGSLDRTVRVIDLETGRCLRELEGHRRGVMCLAISPDGRRLATGSSDGRVRVFDVESGACGATLGGDGGAIKAVAWNGDAVVSAGTDSVLRSWTSSAYAWAVGGHEGEITGLGAFDGVIVSASLDGTVRMWAGADGARLLVHGLGVAITCFALDPVSKRALLGTGDGSVRLHDLERGEGVAALALHEGRTSAVALARDATFGLSTGADAKVRVIELTRASDAPPLVLPRPRRAASREPVEVRSPAAILPPGPAPVLADDWNDRGVWLFEQGDDQAARNAWSAALEVEPHHVEATYNLAVEAWDRGALRDDEVLSRLADARTGPRPSSQTARLLELVERLRLPAAEGGALDAPRCVRTFAEAALTSAPSTITFSPDGRFAFAVDPDGELQVELATGATRRVRGSAPSAPPAQVTLDVERRFDLATGAWLEGHVASASLSVVPDPTSRRALSASWDSTVRLWDLDDGECLKTWSFEQRMSQVAWLPDETRAVAGGEDGLLRVLDLETGDVLHMASAGGWIKALAVSPRDARLCVVAVDPDRFDDRGAKGPALQLWELGSRARSFQPARVLPRAAGEAERHASELSALLDAARAALAARDATGVHAALTAARALPGHAQDRDARELALVAAKELERALVGPRAVWPLRSVDLADSVRRLTLDAGSTLHVLAGDRVRRAFDLAAHRPVVPPTDDLVASAIAVSPQGRFALTAEGDRLAVWDLGERRCVARFEPRVRFESAALSPDGRLALLGSGLDVALHILDVTTGRRVHALPAYAWGVGHIRVSLDGRLAVTGGAGVRVGGRPPAGRGYPDDGFGLRVLDLGTGRFTRAIADDGRGQDGGLAFELSHCAGWALATARCGLRLVDLVAGVDERALDLQRSPHLVAWNGRYAVSSAIGDRELRVFEFDWDFDPRPRGGR